MLLLVFLQRAHGALLRKTGPTVRRKETTNWKKLRVAFSSRSRDLGTDGVLLCVVHPDLRRLTQRVLPDVGSKRVLPVFRSCVISCETLLLSTLLCSTAARSGDGDATHGGSRSRGVRHESERGAASDDYDNEVSKADSDSARRGPLSSVSERPKGHATNQKEVGC